MYSRKIIYNPATAQKEAADRIAYCLPIFLAAIHNLSKGETQGYEQIKINLYLAVDRSLPPHFSGLPDEASQQQLSQTQQNALNYVAVSFMTTLSNELLDLIQPAIDQHKQYQPTRRHSTEGAAHATSSSNHSSPKKRSVSIVETVSGFFASLTEGAVSSAIEKQLEKQRLLRAIEKDYSIRSTLLRIIFIIRHIGLLTNVTPSSQLDYLALDKYEKQLFIDCDYRQLSLEQLDSQTELFTFEELNYLIPFFSAMRTISTPEEIHATRIPSIPTVAMMRAYKILITYVDAALEDLTIELKASGKISDFNALKNMAHRAFRPAQNNISDDEDSEADELTELEEKEIRCYKALTQLESKNFPDLLHKTFVTEYKKAFQCISSNFRESRRTIENPEKSAEEKGKAFEYFSEVAKAVYDLNPQPAAEKELNQKKPKRQLTKRDMRCIGSIPFSTLHSMFKPKELKLTNPEVYAATQDLITSVVNINK